MLVSTYPVIQGQQLRLRVIASVAGQIRAFVTIAYDNGTTGQLLITQTALVGNRSNEIFGSPNVTAGPGTVTAAQVQLVSGTQFRGRVYVRLDFTGSGEGPSLLSDYVYVGHEGQLGQFQVPGPGGGPGYRTAVTLKADGAPAGSTTVALDAANTYRRWHSFLWIYHASAAAASRVLATGIRTPIGTALPTNFTAGGNQDIYRGPSLTLTADEEGMVFIGPKFAMTNDNSTLSTVSTATGPTPLPLDITEEYTLADIVFSVTAGEGTDNDVIYGEREEWLVPG